MLTKLYDYGTMTIVMQQVVSKSQFKARALEYLRAVEENKQPLIVTHGGKPVVKVVPFKEESIFKSLRGTVLEYKKPTEPVSKKDWKNL